jgi:hypothetical protein
MELHTDRRGVEMPSNDPDEEVTAKASADFTQEIASESARSMSAPSDGYVLVIASTHRKSSRSM